MERRPAAGTAGALSKMSLLVETALDCPHCGAEFSTMIDSSQGAHITVEDCAVCCRPIVFTVDCAPGEIFHLTVSAEMS